MTDAGFTEVRTILATGNVLLESTAGVASVRKKAEAALRDRFGYDAWVLAYDIDTVRADRRRLPVRARARRLSVLRHVRHRRRRARRARRAGQDAGPDEKIAPRRRASSTGRCPRAARWTARIGKTMGKPRYKSSTTTRNLRTLDKVLR